MQITSSLLFYGVTLIVRGNLLDTLIGLRLRGQQPSIRLPFLVELDAFMYGSAAPLTATVFSTPPTTEFLAAFQLIISHWSLLSDYVKRLL